MGRVIFRYTLNYSVANICKFLVYTETDLPYANSSSKDGVLSDPSIFHASGQLYYS